MVRRVISDTEERLLLLLKGLVEVLKDDLDDSESDELKEEVDPFARAQRAIARSTAEAIAPIGPGSPEEDEGDEEDGEVELGKDLADDNGDVGRDRGPR